MINKDFYPTPLFVIEKMTKGLALNGRHVLDPSAGKGDILDYLNENGAITMFCEIEPKLSLICSQSSRKLKDDFLKVKDEEVSHIDYIIMNPPFSQDVQHVLHAYKIAPPGTVIRSLINSESHRNAFTQKRGELKILLNDYGSTISTDTYFTDAERPTKVMVTLIELKKPKEETSDEFEGYFEMHDSDDSKGYDGLMPYNEIRDIVQRYVGSCKLYDDVLSNGVKMQLLTNSILPHGGEIVFTLSQDDVPKKKESFKKDLQKGAWKSIFRKMKLEKYMTSNLMKDINKFIEKQSHVPFTMRNIYEMLEIIYGTHSDRMKKVYLEVFDKMTERYSDNRYSVEGWKTNSHYMINKKIIVPHVVNQGWGGEFQIKWGDLYAEMVEDLDKALHHLTGKLYNNKNSLYDFFNSQYKTKEMIAQDLDFINKCYRQYDELAAKSNVLTKTKSEFLQMKIDQEHRSSRQRIYRERGTWYQWSFFEMKFYKKGTMHLKFNDLKVWELFNRTIAEIRGFDLPEAL